MAKSATTMPRTDQNFTTGVWETIDLTDTPTAPEAPPATPTYAKQVTLAQIDALLADLQAHITTLTALRITLGSL